MYHKNKGRPFLKGVLKGSCWCWTMLTISILIPMLYLAFICNVYLCVSARYTIFPSDPLFNQIRSSQSHVSVRLPHFTWINQTLPIQEFTLPKVTLCWTRIVIKYDYLVTLSPVLMSHLEHSTDSTYLYHFYKKAYRRIVSSNTVGGGHATLSCKMEVAARIEKKTRWQKKNRE